MRIAIGCMRLSTDADRDEARSLATLRAVTTAHGFPTAARRASSRTRAMARALGLAFVEL